MKCYIHDLNENLGPGATQCFECGHVYQNDQEIVQEYNDAVKGIAGALEKHAVDEIHFCPLCLHDW